jgi:hypothetical protein
MEINFTRHTPITRMAMVALLTLCFMQSPVSAHAPETALDPMPSPMSDHRDGPIIPPIGFVFGQTLRVTVAGEEVVALPDDTIVDIVHVEVSLLDAQGRVIAQSDEIAIQSGESRSVDFKRDSIPLAGEPGTGRLQVRGQIRHRSFPIIDRTNLRVWPISVELLNETGHTLLFFDPTFAGGVRVGTSAIHPKNAAVAENRLSSARNDFLVGLTPGQTLMISGLNAIDPGSSPRVEPVSLQVKVHDRDGSVIGESDVVEIPPGQFRTLRFGNEDLPVPGEPGTGRNQRRTMALWGLSSSHPFFGVVSLEVVDNSTGRSALLISQKPKEIVHTF